jgi:hypothetical protein
MARFHSTGGSLVSYIALMDSMEGELEGLQYHTY